MRTSQYHPAAVMFLLVASVLVPETVCAADGYKQFFTRTIRASSVLADSSLVPHVGEPEVRAGTNRKGDDIAMLENGYELVGYSSFNGPPENPAKAKAKAKALHAAVVLLYNGNGRTVTETAPAVDMSFVGDVLNPRKETTKTTGTVSGSGGSASYWETSTKTLTPEKKAPQTITYTTTRYDQLATFWVKTKPPRLGIVLRDLTGDERAARQSNRGAVVLAVMKGSPAFLADVLRGDILLEVGEMQIAQSEDLALALDRYAGTEVELLVVRGSSEKTVGVRLNSN